MPRTEVSLIICTYRRPKAVGKLLGALTAQTRPPDEVLIVDGSDDCATKDVVQALRAVGKCPNLRYFLVSPEHRGLTRQRNFGIARATGDVVAFLDDDTVPEPGYFEEVLACFGRHPEAAGVGGYIQGIHWKQVNPALPPGRSAFRCGRWERREDHRTRLRKALGLLTQMPPGIMPRSGHGRPVGFLPPDGQDYKVEFAIGCALAFRKNALERHRFSPCFEGYGLYEDLDFCIRVSRVAPLYLCTLAKVWHYHEPAGRPRPFHYGKMVVRNGWYVWRLRWPSPSFADRVRWWCTTILLALCRLLDLRGDRKRDGILEATGRLVGAVSVLLASPSIA